MCIFKIILVIVSGMVALLQTVKLCKWIIGSPHLDLTFRSPSFPPFPLWHPKSSCYLCSEKLNPIQRAVIHLSSPPRRHSLGPWVSCLIKISLFIRGLWTTPGSPTMWFMGFGPVVTVQPQEGLETEVSHMGSPSCLYGGALLKTLHRPRFHWLAIFCATPSHIVAGRVGTDSTGEDNRKFCIWDFPRP